MLTALDWDEHQIRLVAGTSQAGSVAVQVAAIEPIGEAGLDATLQKLVAKHRLEKSTALIAVGRDQAELRQMSFPPVNDAELPDMVRFQAIQQFASAGDRATVDFLPTERTDEGVKAIVTASGPAKLDPIRKTIEKAGLPIGAIALRPIAAAALYQIAGAGSSRRHTLVLIDMIGDEAEIVLLRGRDIAFVRSVRLPESLTARVSTLAGEIRRSQMACGAADVPCDLAIWGTAERHAEELELLGRRIESTQDQPPQTELIDPLRLVQCDDGIRSSVGNTVGRLAPLVGLLAAHEQHADRLIDFANPRRTPPPESNTRKIAIVSGIAAAFLLVATWALYSRIASLNQQIAEQEAVVAEFKPKVETADQMIERTARVDQFLNGDVNWLDELERLAANMPPAEELILKEVAAVADVRDGGGRLIISGLVTSPEVIDRMEAALRDETHHITGDKVTQLDTNDAYRWQMTETIAIDPAAVQSQRYERIEQASGEANDAASPDETESDPEMPEATATEPAPEVTT